MTMTQTAAVEEVRVRLDEVAPGFFRDSDIRRFINEGVREVARKSEWKRAIQNVSVTGGVQTYVLAADTIEVYRVEYQPANSSLKYPMEYRDLNAMDVVWGNYQSISQGTPTMWSMWSANPPVVYLAPIPSQSGQINVFYYSMPSDLATTSASSAQTALDVPQGWEDLVVEFATGLGFRKSRRAQDYQICMQVFADKLQDFMKVTARYTDAPTMIVPDSASYGMYDPYGY